MTKTQPRNRSPRRDNDEMSDASMDQAFGQRARGGPSNFENWKFVVGLISFIGMTAFQGGTIIWQMSHQNDRITAVETNQATMQADLRAEQTARIDTNTHLTAIEQYIKDVRDDEVRRATQPMPAPIYMAPQQQPAQVILQQPSRLSSPSGN
jgi:hypothetical protein